MVTQHWICMAMILGNYHVNIVSTVFFKPLRKFNLIENYKLWLGYFPVDVFIHP